MEIPYTHYPKVIPLDPALVKREIKRMKRYINALNRLDPISSADRKRISVRKGPALTRLAALRFVLDGLNTGHEFTPTPEAAPKPAKNKMKAKRPSRRCGPVRVFTPEEVAAFVASNGANDGR